jgi:hypothetical protein
MGAKAKTVQATKSWLSGKIAEIGSCSAAKKQDLGDELDIGI